MTKLNNEKLNQLALSYNAGNEFALIELAGELSGFIQDQARRETLNMGYKGVFIPAADFESAITQALWEAAKGYDGSSEFMQRFRNYMKPRCIDVLRQYKTSIDGKATYQKGKADSLDKPVNSEGQTLGDVVFAKLSTGDNGEEAVGENAILDAIEEFKAQNERFYTIIKALSFEATNDEIAKALGEEKYNGKVRAVVCRARESFRKFLLERDFEI